MNKNDVKDLLCLAVLFAYTEGAVDTLGVIDKMEIRLLSKTLEEPDKLISVLLKRHLLPSLSKLIDELMEEEREDESFRSGLAEMLDSEVNEFFEKIGGVETA